MTHLLAEYRKARHLSQLALALQADVSARHISFIETGRAQPSREMLLKLSDILGLSHRDANLLLTACGFAPVFSELSLDGEGMQPVAQALAIMLENHNPYPAVVLDNHWDLRMANGTMQRLMAQLLPPECLQPPINMLALIFDPKGLRQYITNWDCVAGILLRRLRLQTHTQANSRLAALFKQLLAMNPPVNWQTPEVLAGEGPMLTSNLSIFGQRLSLFSTLTSFGTPLDAGLQELVIESYFPADEATRQFFNAAAGSH